MRFRSWLTREGWPLAALIDGIRVIDVRELPPGDSAEGAFGRLEGIEGVDHV